MELLIRSLQDIQKVDLSLLTPELIFWLGFLCGHTKTLASANLELLKSLNTFSKLGDINPALKSFLFLTLIINKPRFNDLYIILSSGLSVNSIKKLLSQSENSYFQVIYNLLNPPIVHKLNQSNSGGIKKSKVESSKSKEKNFTQDSQNFNHDTFIPETETKCMICYEKSSVYEYSKLSYCDCFYHKTCLNTYLKIQIKNKKFKIGCPKCYMPLSQCDILERIDYDDSIKFRENEFRHIVSQNSSEHSCCPNSACNNIFNAAEQEHFICNVCKNEYCLSCKTIFHKGKTCAQYKLSGIGKKNMANEKNLVKFVIGKNFKECSNCKFWVEKSFECNRMVCGCQNEFCFNCGGKYNVCECTKNNMS